MNRQQNGCAPSCRAGVLALLGKRNTRECGKWSEVFGELFNLRNDLDTAKASQFALQREAVAASVSCPDADLSGLLADTPVAPHMRLQISTALRLQLAPLSGRAMPLDHLLISGCDAVIACLLATSPAASPTASAAAAGRSSNQDPPTSPAPSPSGSVRKWVGSGREACDELCIGDLESCFAGSVCTSLVADQRGMRAFDLTRMHRLVAKFRALIADACYGTVQGNDYSAVDAGGDTREHTLRDEMEETPRDDDGDHEAAAERDVPLTPHEELIYRKARRHMTDTVMDLHQRLYTSEILLAEKHQEVVQCYQRMADRAKEFQALHTQLTKLRQEHTSAIKDAQARKRYSTGVDEENVLLKRQMRQQVDVVKGLEASLVTLRQQLETCNARVKSQQDELKRNEKALVQAQSDGQIVAQTLVRDVDCLLSVSCRLQSEHLALRKVCSSYEATIDELHLGHHSPSVRQSHPNNDWGATPRVMADTRACKHPLGAGFNDPEHICLEFSQNAQDEGGRVDVVREEGERSAHAVEKNMDGGAKPNGLGDSKANEPGGNVREGGCRLSAVVG
eukprot:CAMPEP_0179443374 /NCGR_PEP_ID=MMETSP0799-20121207/26807_1 /TAXON_ID=46947 /ORGANISM="Geminigera cryophila, Strain CCMP2564" /LENGTH=564 /DNA_ID=CAMNT_0021229327 /DNA_START=356 /DNA_END=2046 /DNA_ORIENTATION=-